MASTISRRRAKSYHGTLCGTAGCGADKKGSLIPFAGISGLTVRTGLGLATDALSTMTASVGVVVAAATDLFGSEMGVSMTAQAQAVAAERRFTWPHIRSDSRIEVARWHPNKKSGSTIATIFILLIVFAVLIVEERQRGSEYEH